MTLVVPDTAQQTFEFPKLTFCVPSLAAWRRFAVLRPKAVWLAWFIMCLGLSSASPASQKFRMLVPTMIGVALTLEKLGGQVVSCRFRALRPFYQYTLLA